MRRLGPKFFFLWSGELPSGARRCRFESGLRYLHCRINMDKILVVIPYLASAAQGNELELAVDGWMKHFKDPHHVVIIGDWDEHVYKALTDDPDAAFISCPRVIPIEGQYTPHIDHVRKFRVVHKRFTGSKGFIYTCDDIYPTADFTLEDVFVPKHPESGPYFKPYEWRSNAVGWWSDRGKTAELCQKEGLPVRDWVCHTPVYYEWDKLLAIYDKYDCDHNSYIVENIYFSQEYGNDHSVPATDYRDEVRTSNPCIHPIGSKIWVTNANCGWSEKLEKNLREHYRQ